MDAPSAGRVSRPLPMPPELADHEALVLNKLATWVHQCIDAEMAAEGLRARHYLVMSVMRTGVHTGQQEIADKLNIDKATMAAVVGELEARDLLGRARNPADRRHYRLWTTDSGRTWLASADAIIGAAEDEMFSPLDATERSQLLSLMQRLFAS
jgi:DNA-binding MarR family transcriptional regulator